jgi:hypothetical protein
MKHTLLVRCFNTLIFFVLISGYAIGQANTGLSPYSVFGLGDLSFKGYSHQKGESGTGIAEFSPSRLNYFNPATYAYDTLTILEFGATSERLIVKQGGEDTKLTGGTLDHLAIGFPILRNKIGVSFGFVPFSNVGYNLQYDQIVNEVRTNVLFVGSGGYVRYFMGTGFKLNKHLSAGMNASYFYGTESFNRKINYANVNYFDSKYIYEQNIHDLYLEFGMHWADKLNDKLNYSIGLSGAPQQNLNAKQYFLWENLVTSPNGTESIRDTVSYIPDESGTIVMPMYLGLGFTLSQSKKWNLNMDITYQDWSSLERFGTSDSLENSLKVGIGGQYIPDAKGLSYYNRIQYRAGIYFNNSYIKVGNEPINDYGISIGAGFPLRKAYSSMINTALQFGERGTTANGLVKESYFRLTLAITINEDWFRRQPYE